VAELSSAWFGCLPATGVAACLPPVRVPELSSASEQPDNAKGRQGSMHAPFMRGVVRKASPEPTSASEAATARERRRPIVPVVNPVSGLGGAQRLRAHPAQVSAAREEFPGRPARSANKPRYRNVPPRETHPPPPPLPGVLASPPLTSLLLFSLRVGRRKLVSSVREQCFLAGSISTCKFSANSLATPVTHGAGGAGQRRGRDVVGHA